MPVSSHLKIQSKTEGAITSNTSQQWRLHLNAIHDNSGETTNLSDVEICIAIQHYWLSANSLSGLTIDVDYAGNVRNGSGSRGDVYIEYVDYDDIEYIPIIYPIGENKRYKTIIKITYPESTFVFSNAGAGLMDLKIRIRDFNYKAIKYFNYNGIKTDIEDSYSYRDDNGEDETQYSDNNKICINDLSNNNLIWGIPPHTDDNNIYYNIIEPVVFSTIDQANPTISYENNTTSIINIGTENNAKRCVFIGSGNTFSDIGQILRCEILFKHIQSGHLNDGVVEILDILTLPNNSPTWNEVEPNSGNTLQSLSINSSFSNTCWMFSNEDINILIQKWLRSWNTEHKGLILKYSVENVGGSADSNFGNHNSESFLKPLIIVAYKKRRFVR